MKPLWTRRSDFNAYLNVANRLQSACPFRHEMQSVFVYSPPHATSCWPFPTTERVWSILPLEEKTRPRNPWHVGPLKVTLFKGKEYYPIPMDPWRGMAEAVTMIDDEKQWENRRKDEKLWITLRNYEKLWETIRNVEKPWENMRSRWESMRNGEKWSKRWETMKSDEKQWDTMLKDEK